MIVRSAPLGGRIVRGLVTMAMHVRCSPSPSVIGGARSELLPRALLFSLSGHVRQMGSVARHGDGSKDNGTSSTHLQPKGACHLPFWKAGCGHYGNTLGQKYRRILTASEDLVLSYIDTIPVEKDGVFTFGDYGTNDGYPSMHLMCSVIEHLRKKHGDDLTIQIIYEDQEENDFNSLFSRLNDSSSYLSKFPNVYPLATNINFYKRCVPDGFCDVVFTSIANHWMEKLDMSFKDCVFDTFATEEECQRFREETERDWTKFLALRAKELKPGGILIAINGCTSSSYRSGQGEITPTKSEAEGPEVNEFEVFQDLEHVWKQLRDDRVITQEEFENCSCPQRNRNAEEIKSPFEKPGSVVRQAGLCLEHYDEMAIPCIFKDWWREHNKKDSEKSRAVFADIQTKAHQVWSRTTFYSALSTKRSEMEKSAILDELYRRFHSLVMGKDPESYVSENLVYRMVARKV